MPATSPGMQIDQPGKAKKQTMSTNLHRFEPFSKRITRLKIDPIHRVQQNDSLEKDVELSKTHFGLTINHWVELNLSENFTQFAREVKPLSESLPQILHHADSIFGLFIRHIAKMDSSSAEPLLGLLADFFHDLNLRSEKYFAEAVSLVLSVAARNEASDLIEWSFSCLAYMLKYLSRLLVLDLRPLLAIMTPYLGKERQKVYITRFAAESMAFLVRKASMMYHKDKVPLDQVVSYFTEDLAGPGNQKEKLAYHTGLMSLYMEAIMGVDGGGHSSSTHLVSCLIKYAKEPGEKGDHSRQILAGVMISVIHQTNARGFLPLADLISKFCRTINNESLLSDVALAARLLMIIVGTRKGSRVSDWKEVLDTLVHVSQTIKTLPLLSDPQITQDIVAALAMAVQYSPLDALLPLISIFLETFSSGALAGHFLPFCLVADRTNRERFKSLILPSLQKYIVKQWQHDAEALCLLTRRLCATGLDLSATAWPERLPGRSLMEAGLIRGICADADEAHATHLWRDGLAQFAEDLGLPRDSTIAVNHVVQLESRTVGAFKRDDASDGSKNAFETGRGFRAYVRLAKLTKKTGSIIWAAICRDPLPPTHCPIFLAALSGYLQELTVSGLELSQVRTLLTRLVENLLEQTTEVKVLSVRLIQQITRQSTAHEMLALLLQLLQIPCTMDTVRTITMLIRRIPVLQKDLKSDPLLQKVGPYFCLGLSSSSPAPVIDELNSTLSAISEDDATNENLICDVLTKWLLRASTQAPHDPSEERTTLGIITRYQCSNLQTVESFAQESFDLFSAPKKHLEKELRAQEANICERPVLFGRLQALRVFNFIPQAAEKRSRFVIPVFLSMKPAQDFAGPPLDSDTPRSSHTVSPEVLAGDWCFPARKAFLEMLGKFKNPRVLFRSQEVFDALLDFLKVGQPEIQRLALKAIMTWKLPATRKYGESFLKLTDEKSYRDELTNLFRSDDESNADSSAIKEEDRTDVLPILLRLLYGQMVSRSGSKGNRGGQEMKRKTTLRVLFRMREHEISQFLDITFGEVPLKVGPNSELQQESPGVDVIGTGRQHGLVRTAKTMLEVLRGQLAPFGERILEAVLYCLYCSSGRLENVGQDDAASETDIQTSISRVIRRTAIQCLRLIFSSCDRVRWAAYLPSLFDHVIRPKLKNFSVETAQGVSGLLQIFATWASDASCVSFLHSYDESLLDRVADCLTTPSAKDDVKVYVLDQVFAKLAELATQSSTVAEGAMPVLRAHMSYLLSALNLLLQNRPSQKLVESAVSLLAGLTLFVDSSIDVESLIDVITTLLAEPPNKVGPKVKGDLLRALLPSLGVSKRTTAYSTSDRLRQTVISLFNYFRDFESRYILAKVQEAISLGNEQANEVASICSRLNAVSLIKLDEIDYDARLDAFNSINAKLVEDLPAALWEPVVQNLIFFARAAEDFAIRSNAISSLRRLISESRRLRQPEFDALLESVVLPALKKGTRAESESVRADHVALFGLLVKECSAWQQVDDMVGLLAGNDEDASFFNNILHIQHHRRTRAMRRLAAEADRGLLRSNSICTFLIPLLEIFVFDQKDDEGVRNLRGQAIPTIGALLQWIDWNQFRAIFRRYKGYISSKPNSEKDVIKLISVSADALVSSCSIVAANPDMATKDVACEKRQKALSKTLPSNVTLSQELSTHFIPDLASYIHEKDESQITSRIPVAITAVKLLKILPQTQMAQFLQPLLLDIAYILRSRSQDSRDMARRTLAEVTKILGPSCLRWVLKELRASLARGYQLHVLSYTVHSILVANSDLLEPGNLDECIGALVTVVMDDVFGTIGQEKDAEEYVSKMREVKSSKSFDSMELLARSSSVNHLIELIRPLQSLLTGPLTQRQSRQIDELLRRIGLGLSRNPVAKNQDMLIFAYQIIQELYNEKQGGPQKPLTSVDLNRERLLVQPAAANQNTKTRSSSSIFKLAKFGLDILRSTLQKHGDLLKPENVHGFLPMFGDALVQNQEDVKMSAMRTLSAVIKLPMAELDASSSVYIFEAVKVVRDSISTNSEAAQAALKLITAILRERRSVGIRDSDLSYLLHRIMPDLEEPERQGVTFNFVKAVMARKIMLPEVYDVNKKIGTIMVTNQGQNARDAARGIFIHFLLEFPQSKERWNKQIKFLVKNLSYQYPEGRQSVMEAVHTLLNKVDASVNQELTATMFIPLVLIMANDDNVECRQMAGALIGRCLEQADGEQLRLLVVSLRGWIEQSQNPALRRTGLQAFKILFEVPNVKAEKEIHGLLSAIHQIVKETAQTEAEERWETLYYALQLFSKLVTSFPATALAQQQSHLWSSIRALLSYPHPWIQVSAASLIGGWFHDLAVANGKTSLGTVPLAGQYGLGLTDVAQLDVLRSSIRILKRNWSSKELSAQTVQNLVFLGRCFTDNNLTIDSSASTALQGLSDQNEIGEDDPSDPDTEKAAESSGKTSAITHLIIHLSSTLRHEPRKLTTATLLPKISSIQLLSALTHHILSPTLLALLPTIVLPPLAHLTDPTLPAPSANTLIDPNFATTYRDLVTSASEVLDLIQKKVGSAEYIKAMSEAQAAKKRRREERSVKRKVQMVADPEKAIREKRRKAEKEKRRLKGKKEGFRKGRKGL